MLKIPVLDAILLQFTEKSPLDNLCDRAHYLFTTLMLFYFAALIAGKQTFGEPIRCMTPGEYGGGWSKYVNEYCFSTNTFVDQLGGYNEKMAGGVINIGYYQWVPYMFLAQAAFFYIPHIIWMHLQSRTDLDFESSVKQALVIRQQHEPKRREYATKKLAAYLCRVNHLRRESGRGTSGLGLAGSLAYVASKALNLVNVAVQFVVVALFVGQGRLDWGFKLAADAIKGVSWRQGVGLFPRVAYCKFNQLSSAAGGQDRISQCALMINMLNEKLFGLIYFWFLALFLFTLVDLVWSVAHYILGLGRLSFGKKYLNLAGGSLDSGELMTEAEMRQFIFKSLGNDGLLLFRFIDNMAGGAVASEIACCFYARTRTDPDGVWDQEEFAEEE